MQNLIKKLYINIGSYKYQIKFLTNGKMYFVRSLTSKGFNKFMQGKLEVKSGII